MIKEKMLDHPGVVIHSVKRLSDGKVFSIGDEVRYIIGNKAFPFTITGFFIVGHDNSIFAENEYHFCNINYETFNFTDTQKREVKSVPRTVKQIAASDNRLLVLADDDTLWKYHSGKWNKLKNLPPIQIKIDS